MLKVQHWEEHSRCEGAYDVSRCTSCSCRRKGGHCELLRLRLRQLEQPFFDFKYFCFLATSYSRNTEQRLRRWTSLHSVQFGLEVDVLELKADVLKEVLAVVDGDAEVLRGVRRMQESRCSRRRA